MSEAALPVIIGNNVQHFRKRVGLTQGQLAERAELSNAYISRVERGEKGLSVASLLRLSEALDVSCDAILKKPSADIHIQNIRNILNDCPEGFVCQVEQVIRVMKEHQLGEPYAGQ